ncbi:MarR family transcriptional regulator [Azorhizobium oxalatiphilum]|uniref:MarR family transcriptional regulator n=1 Tax=Azorhizobium oxalatiphilum TaxID=980631 RepID=A0A917C8V3_9HYPH|nr:MarR family transcriptional regulator [Azorhizobium oxalatiphilum]GGF77452.1 MarR family transcriptional regulator [Azorhizobium oxalatiphilum]
MVDSRSASPRRATGKAEDPDYAALAEFRYAIRKFLAFSEEAAAEAGLTSQQHQALLTIKGVDTGEGLSIGGLAQRLLVRQHTAVELVDRLERTDLVRRAADPSDGRRVLVTLTREGEKRLKQLSAAHLDELRSIGPTLTDILATLRTPPS